MEETTKETAHKEPKDEKTQEKKPRRPRDGAPRKKGAQTPSNAKWNTDLKKMMGINENVHKRRLNPYNPTKHDGKIRITPLGGLNEIGGNLSVIESDTAAIIVDVGMSFPDAGMHGVDILIPDFSYLKSIQKKLKAIIITHAHEDHIGAMPFLFKEIQLPIYATPLPLAMIAGKFDEHGLKSAKKHFRPVEKRKIYNVGEFKIEWIHTTHSVVDASALAIMTPAGTIIHTGDFKIDHSPVDGYPTDLNRFAFYGDKGVLAMLSDSTNSHRSGWVKSESVVGKTFERIFKSHDGRLIMSTFSSNIHRIQQAIDVAISHNRKVCIIGRSMEKNLFSAIDLGYMKYPKELFVDQQDLARFNDDEILIVTTGSQGEMMSALYRIATEEHRHVKLKTSDLVVISAKAIPGNEASVSNMINLIMKGGAKVAYQDYEDIHVSGHAAQEEQKLLIRLCKPKFFIPVHGEYNFLIRHKQSAIEAGVTPRNVAILHDGDQIEITPKYIKKAKTVRTGKNFVDNNSGLIIANNVIDERDKIANEGIVIIALHVNTSTGKLTKKPLINSYGLVNNKRNSLQEETLGMIDVFMTSLKPEILQNKKTFETRFKQQAKKLYFKKFKKYPVVNLDVFYE